jgi:hypothetical protein
MVVVIPSIFLVRTIVGVDNVPVHVQAGLGVVYRNDPRVREGDADQEAPRQYQSLHHPRELINYFPSKQNSKTLRFKSNT